MFRFARFFLLLLCASSGVAHAQRFFTQHDFGVVAGGSQYFGDINDNYGFAFVRPAAGLTYRHLLTPYIAVKATALGTQVGYDDALTGNPFNERRNLNFKSWIGELSVQAEFNFFRFITGDENARFTPYLTGGIGAFYFDPYTTYKGDKVYLRPLGTEGQNTSGYGDRKYGSVSVCFPLGAGVKYWIAPGVNLSVEIADRLTLTDYMDDISTTYVGTDQFSGFENNTARALQDRSSEVPGVRPIGVAGKQRGNSASFDQYATLLIGLSFQFKTYQCPSYQTENYQYPR